MRLSRLRDSRPRVHRLRVLHAFRLALSPASGTLALGESWLARRAAIARTSRVYSYQSNPSLPLPPLPAARRTVRTLPALEGFARGLLPADSSRQLATMDASKPGGYSASSTVQSPIGATILRPEPEWNDRARCIRWRGGGGEGRGGEGH